LFCVGLFSLEFWCRSKLACRCEKACFQGSLIQKKNKLRVC